MLMMAFIFKSNYHIDMSLNMEINSITSEVIAHIYDLLYIVGTYSGVILKIEIY